MPILQDIENALDGTGLHWMLVFWSIATFASYVLIVVVAYLTFICFTVMVGLKFFHKDDKQKKTMGVAASAVMLVFLSLIPICQKNYYV